MTQGQRENDFFFHAFLVVLVSKKLNPVTARSDQYVMSPYIIKYIVNQAGDDYRKINHQLSNMFLELTSPKTFLKLLLFVRHSAKLHRSTWCPFLESSGNLPGPITVFGDKCFLTEVNFW